MKAGPIEIGTLLSNHQRFCVPIYQRHYVWTRDKQWAPFWSDIRTKAIERLAGRDRRFSHFMGAVVLEARGRFTTTRVPSLLVIDGQQRLITFQLFLAAAHDYALTADLADTAATIHAFMRNDERRPMEDPIVEIHKVWPTRFDREMFVDIVKGDRPALRRKYHRWFYTSEDKIYPYRTVPRMLAAYGFFYDRIKYAVETDDLDDEFTTDSGDTNSASDTTQAEQIDTPNGRTRLDAVWRALVEEFKMVRIELEDGDDAQVIFETLNERGEPLLAADLVRNNIFYRAEGANEDAERLFAEHWVTFEDPFWSVEEKQGRYKKPRLELFLSNFIAGKIAGDVNLSKLFSEYKAFVKDVQYRTVVREVKDLATHGDTYRELVERKAESVLGRFGRRLLPWDVTTVFPLVLRLWQSEMEEGEKRRSLDVLLALIVRRGVCGLTTKNYNKFFLSAVADLDRNGWSADRLVAFLLEQKAESGRFPRDDEFGKAWINKPAYTMLRAGRVRAILEEIELAERSRFNEAVSLPRDLTIEHVLPREWAEHWVLPNGTTRPTELELLQAEWTTEEDETTVGLIVRRNRLKESMGNLTLVTQPLNSALSNGPFARKRGVLADHSLLVLNRVFTRHESWDEHAIAERGGNLFQTARSLWPMPRVSGGGA